MQKSDVITDTVITDTMTITEYFDRVIDLTRCIQQSLSENGDTAVLGQMYDERGTMLTDLQKIRSSLPDNPEFKEQWNKKTAQLVEADRELLSVLEIVKDTYQEKVRQSNQQKYLLIYSKGQRYGY